VKNLSKEPIHSWLESNDNNIVDKITELYKKYLSIQKITDRALHEELQEQYYDNALRIVGDMLSFDLGLPMEALLDYIETDQRIFIDGYINVGISFGSMNEKT